MKKNKKNKKAKIILLTGEFVLKDNYNIFKNMFIKFRIMKVNLWNLLKN